MRVHPNQVNPNAQLDAMYAAQKAEAKREAARTRKKLMEFAAELAGQAEVTDIVVTFTPEENGGQDRREPDREQAEAKSNDSSLSDWA